MKQNERVILSQLLRAMGRPRDPENYMEEEYGDEWREFRDKFWFPADTRR
tara:strand:+ start:296 stop:445 length:150 start_codon:yes stop_codon:yes gene_type:complete